MLDYELSSGLDSSELIQPLGGPQAIAQLSDFNLEKLGRAQFTVVDPRADAEFENCPLELAVEEDDTPLDAAEILRLSGAESLDKVLALSVPCCGYTSVNAFDLTRCINLRELDLSENALRVFPRRLHLSNLRKLGLTGNRFIHLPLIEQFPKLSGLTIDEKLKQVGCWLSYKVTNSAQANNSCVVNCSTSLVEFSHATRSSRARFSAGAPRPLRQ